MAKGNGIEWTNGDPAITFPVRWRAGLLNLLFAIDERAKDRAPKDTGALVNSGRTWVTAKGEGYNQFGGESIGYPDAVHYAKMRHYNNNLHPATRFYLTGAVNDILEAGIRKYFDI